MKVINVLVSSPDNFIELLIRSLIKNEIGYVQVDEYEFHMLDNIYRFYPLDDQKAENAYLSESEFTINYNEFVQNNSFNKFVDNSSYLSYFDKDSFEYNKIDTKSQNKKNDIKRENRVVNGIMNMQKNNCYTKIKRFNK